MSALSQATRNLSVSDTEPVLNDSERQKCEVWTRVMGYFRPVESHNIGKRQEFVDRVCYEMPESITRETTR